jgi:DNA-directed RNA polymerase subunit RPC12/RpoP
MKIKCSACKQDFQLPEEKVKGLTKFAVKCPRCGEKIIVNRKEEERPEEDSLLESKTCLEFEPENIPVGKASALLFIKDVKLITELGDFLQEKEYFLREVKDYPECRGRLLINNYDLIFLEEGEDADKLLAEINTWPQLRRRNTNIILIGQRGRDFDQKISFEKSVNFYLNKESGEFFLKLEKCLNDFAIYLSCWKQNDETRTQV